MFDSLEQNKLLRLREALACEKQPEKRSALQREIALTEAMLRWTTNKRSTG